MSVRASWRKRPPASPAGLPLVPSAEGVDGLSVLVSEMECPRLLREYLAADYNRLAALLWPVIGRRVRGRAAIEDILQDIFVGATTCPKEMTLAAAERYLLKAARTRAVTHQARRAQLGERLREFGPHFDCSIDTFGMGEREEFDRDFWEAVARLPLRQRTVARLKLADHSNEEIAEAISMSIATVVRDWGKARQFLAQELAPWGEE